MKHTTLGTATLIFLLAVCPALKGQEEQQRSWFTPFTEKSFLYPAVIIAGGLVLYKIIQRLTRTDLIDVEVPWDGNNIAESDDSETRCQPLQEVAQVLESHAVFLCEAGVPQLVTLHAQLEDPELDDEQRKELEYELAQLEEQVPAFAQTIPLLTMSTSAMQAARQEVWEQLEAQEVNRSAYTSEYEPLLKTIDLIDYYSQKFIELYGTEPTPQGVSS